MSHVKPVTLTLGEMVGKVCDLEGDSKLLKDLAIQPALSPALVPHQGLVFWGKYSSGMGCLGCIRALTALIESLLTTCNLEAFSVH